MNIYIKDDIIIVREEQHTRVHTCKCKLEWKEKDALHIVQHYFIYIIATSNS